MATCSIILVWEIPWTAEPAMLQSMGPQGFGHDLMTKTTRVDIDLPHLCPSWKRAWWPTPVFLPGESQGQRNLVGSTEPLMRGGVPGCPAQSQLCWGGAKTGRGRVPGHREALQPQGPSRRPLQEQRALRTQGRSVGFHGEVGRVAGQPGAPA